ncbi:MAG: DUF1868 domain-containing protein [Bdellovibrionia bacterium]
MKKLIWFAFLVAQTACSGVPTKKSQVIYPTSGKLSAQGTYLPFAGVTVVAKVKKENRPFFEELHQELKKSPVISRYFALLPVSSFHMTTTNLYTEKDRYAGSWNDFISSHLPVFASLYKRLESAQFEPQVHMEKLAVAGTIKIVVRFLNEEQENTVRKIAKEFNQEPKIPNPFHITMGYLYQDLESDTKQEIEQELQRITQKILASHPEPLTLEVPKLSYFFDMLDFFPWEAKRNPFETSSSH